MRRDALICFVILGIYCVLECRDWNDHLISRIERPHRLPSNFAAPERILEKNHLSVCEIVDPGPFSLGFLSIPLTMTN